MDIKRGLAELDVERSPTRLSITGDFMAFSVSEMYDLCTVQDKIGIIGIHTPIMPLIARSWKGMLDNHRYLKLLSCTVRVACASHLPVDPLKIGTDTGEVSPQDMMNPILYRACTNDGWNVIMNRVYGNGNDRNSMRYFSDAFASLDADTQEQIYYALLASDEWRKAMPQVGLEMKGLKPFVYQVVNTYGNSGSEYNGSSASSILDNVKASNASGIAQSPASTNLPVTFRGHAMPYPAIPCSLPGSISEEGQSYPTLTIGSIPKSYVACIVMPPSKNQIMYYRLMITWYFDFIKPVPLYDKYAGYDVATAGLSVYGRSYSDGSKDIVQADNSVVDGDVKEGGTLDTIDAPLNLVLQK